MRARPLPYALAGLALALAVGAAAQGTPTEGEVLKVDATTRRISLRHAEIRNLDLPPMKMQFQVRDPALLERVKPGDKVRFTAEKVNGIYTLTTIEVVK